jgi:hypothetical protein
MRRLGLGLGLVMGALWSYGWFCIHMALGLDLYS